VSSGAISSASKLSCKRTGTCVASAVAGAGALRL
jgi:hypothetical protein